MLCKSKSANLTRGPNPVPSSRIQESLKLYQAPDRVNEPASATSNDLSSFSRTVAAALR